jgi:hypothetical protein
MHHDLVPPDRENSRWHAGRPTLIAMIRMQLSQDINPPVETVFDYFSGGGSGVSLARSPTTHRWWGLIP